MELWCFLFRSSRTLGVTPRPPYRETSVCTPCINSPYHWTGSVCTMCPPPRPPVRTRYWHDNAQFYKYVYPCKYSSILLILTNKKVKKKRSFIQSGLTNVDRSAGPTKKNCYLDRWDLDNMIWWTFRQAQQNTTISLF